jgi:NADH-quinone oxidoreductase subunit G
MSAQPTNNTAPDLVNIEIDGVPLQAPKGSMLIQAADKAGIPIPRFCYHEKLPIAANCRMCLVDVEKAPKPMPACASPVMEGMKVFTKSRRALDAQRNVMEFLLINHPLDCPICDQGGECELQDVSLGYGRSVSRYVERKRVVADEDIGPLVATEMTRCIHCTRCVRVSAEICGTYELGGMSRGENLVIGTYDGKPLTSELSGNVIDVCPVGALTNKVFRFRARPWELIARESIGYHDALGSNLFLHMRRNEVMRTVPRDNAAVNECWLSDRDRYSHQGLYAADRLTQPMLKQDGQWKAASWDEALATAAGLLKAQSGDQLGVLAHPATSNEEGALLKRLADGLGCGNIDHRLRTLDFADAPVAEPFAAPVAELDQAGVVLIVGSLLRHELPLVAQRLRQAVKRGCKVFVLNPVAADFAFPLAGQRVLKPSQLPAALAELAAGQGGDAAWFEALKSATDAVVLLGEIAETHPQASRLRAAARRLAEATGARLNRVPLGANAVGLARQGLLPSGLDARAMLAQPRKAYLLFGMEPPHDVADGALAMKALSGAKVVAFAAFAPESLKDVADVLLPIAALPEMEAGLTNLDGIEQTTRAGGKPPGDARPGWRVLRALGGSLELAGFEFTDLAGLRAGMKAVEARCGQGEAAEGQADGEGLERIASAAIYRADAVLRRAAALAAHPLTTGAQIRLNPEDALARGLSHGAIAKVDDGRGTAALPVAVDAGVARGAAWIESGYDATAPIAPAGTLNVTRA